MIDLNLISRGSDYNELKSSYIIFICTKDPFTLGKCKYTFVNQCVEYPRLVLDDGSVKFFLNASGDFEGLSEEFKDLMSYIASGDIKGEFVEKLDKEVKKAILHEEWRDEYMTLMMRDKQNFNEGLSLGREEGQNSLVKAITALREGATESSLRQCFDEQTIKNALEALAIK